MLRGLRKSTLGRMNIKRAPPFQGSNSLQKVELESFRCHICFLGYLAGADPQLSTKHSHLGYTQAKAIRRECTESRCIEHLLTRSVWPEKTTFQVEVGLSLDRRYSEGFGILGPAMQQGSEISRTCGRYLGKTITRWSLGQDKAENTKGFTIFEPIDVSFIHFK